jgi:RNA polymerase sigma factor (sigma-70 family)
MSLANEVIVITPEVHTMIEHFFRHESGKLSSVLARTYGLRNLADLEDIVQDSLLAAMLSWSFRGIPEYPTAWLYQVAKNKTVDMLHRRTAQSQRFVPLEPDLEIPGYEFDIEKIMLAGEIADSQLRMMFACCHPGIPVSSQIALTLKTLCGFSVREIANAFLTKEKTIEKRLGRARTYFREHHVELEAPVGTALNKRRGAVLASLYLLFNEGYMRTEGVNQRSSRAGLMERDLCLEALRLGLLLASDENTRSPEVLALIALMMLIAARFDTRMNEEGGIVLLSAQDRSKWNRELIEAGLHHLLRSEPDRYTSSYHLEAAIQSLHVTAPSFEETDWPAILGLYKRLYAMKPSAIIAMHMSVSMSHVHGPQAAIEWLQKYPLPEYYLYHAILGDAFAKAEQNEAAERSLSLAVKLTRNAREKAFLEERLANLSSVPGLGTN